MKNIMRAIFIGYTGFLTGLAVTGIAIVAVGSLAQSRIVSVLLVSVGGAIFGTSFSSVVSRLSGGEILQEIRSLLKIR